MSKHEGQHESQGFVSEREAREHLATLAGAAGRVAAAGWSGTWMAIACFLGGIILGALAMRREGTRPVSPLQQQPPLAVTPSRTAHLHGSGTASPPARSVAALQTGSAAVEGLRRALTEARTRAEFAEARLHAVNEAGTQERASALATQQLLEQQLAAERVARLRTELILRGALVRRSLPGTLWPRPTPWPTQQGGALRPIPESSEAASEESLEP